jgi:hypothetical protein
MENVEEKKHFRVNSLSKIFQPEGFYYILIFFCILQIFDLGNPRRHIATLQSLTKKTCQGEPSLQNTLELANQTLRYTDI